VGRIQAGIGGRRWARNLQIPVAAVWHGAAWTANMSVTIVKGLWRIALGPSIALEYRRSYPIASMAGQQPGKGSGQLASSPRSSAVNLAVLNLLPVRYSTAGTSCSSSSRRPGPPLSLKKREVASSSDSHFSCF